MSLQTKVSTVLTAKYTILEGVLEGPCPWDSASIEQQESTLLLLMALPCLVCSGVVSLVLLREVSVCASPNEDAQKNDSHLGNFLDSGITLVFCNLETIGCTIICHHLSLLISG